MAVIFINLRRVVDTVFMLFEYQLCGHFEISVFSQIVLCAANTDLMAIRGLVMTF